MLLSYFDDSHDDKNEEYAAVGGLIAGEPQWGRFHVPWAVATINLQKPFHSTDCESQYDQFKNWQKEDCVALMAKLVDIILDLGLHGYGSVVPVKEYRAVFPDSTDPFDPYYLAVRHTLINMATIGAREQELYLLGSGMECWFEKGDVDGTTCRIFKALQSLATWEHAKALRGIHFEDKSLRPLQAADVIAREAFKYFKNLGTIRTRIPVDRMRNVLNFSCWNRECLEYLRDNGGPEDLGLLTSWGAPGRPAPPRFASYWKNF
jgi:hypothetical protein